MSERGRAKLLQDNELPLVASAQTIQETVERLAAQISQDYQGQAPLALGVLKGAFIFLADLVRKLAIPVEVEFIRVASYGRGLHSRGTVRLISAPRATLKGREVLLVEDIVDEGHTIRFLRDYCQKKGAASVKLCALFVKGDPATYPFPIEYHGLQVPKRFVVGYGLDAAERYRYLPDLRALIPEKESVGK